MAFPAFPPGISLALNATSVLVGFFSSPAGSTFFSSGLGGGSKYSPPPEAGNRTYSLGSGTTFAATTAGAVSAAAGGGVVGAGVGVATACAIMLDPVLSGWLAGVRFSMPLMLMTIRASATTP